MHYKMKLKALKECDVFVMGAGIAGIMSAIHAAKESDAVIISSVSNIFSGSSFYKGTWGLGLIGPENKDDENDLIDTIKRVGCGLIDDSVTRKFVTNIQASLDELEEMGIKLKKAENNEEEEFIPCFDHKKRKWNGILFDNAKEVLQKQLDKNKVLQMPFTTVIDLIKENDILKGVVIINKNKEIEYIKCKSIVIASGGFGGVFKHRLNSIDIISTGQAIALKAGCSLLNIEFMQMMLGYINPAPKTIFNEKTFKYVQFLDENRVDIFKALSNKEELLKQRSKYGPFTSRLSSKEIDFIIFDEFLKNKNGVLVRYKEELYRKQSEFVKVYFDWLYKFKKLTIEDEINVGIYFHASNGGIKIDENASTQIEGIFAAGEVTGGMHGADRIGGLSTANGLVFGRIAGKAAINHAKTKKHYQENEIEFDVFEINEAKKKISIIQDIMFKAAMINREEKVLDESIRELENICMIKNRSETLNIDNLINSYRLESNLILSKAILHAIKMRKESRGSHYRSDFPFEQEGMNKKIIVNLKGEDINVFLN